MKLTISNKSGYVLAGCLAGFMASVAFMPILSVFAVVPNASYNDLSEVQAYIRQCRKIIPSISQAIVYDNTDASAKPPNEIVRLTGGTEVRLTGVLRGKTSTDPTVAQIYLPTGTLSPIQPVGWVSANQLTACPPPMP